MVVALLILVVLTAAGVTYMSVARTDSQISGNALSSAKALYAAEAGVSEGLHRMGYPAEVANYIGPAGNPAPGWGRYIVMKSGDSHLDSGAAALASDGLDNDGDAVVDEPGERYPEVLTKQAAGSGRLKYPYVRVAYKTQGGQLVLFGDADNNPATPQTQNLTTGSPVLQITARGEEGSATKVIEAEGVRFPLIDVYGAIYSGKKFEFKTEAFDVDGNDHYATAPYDTVPGGVEVPGILTKGPTSDVILSPTQENNVTGAGGIPSVEQSTVNYDFNALWSALWSIADYKYTGNKRPTTDIGTLADPKIIAVDGNLHTKDSWRGVGILIVNGDIDIMSHNSGFTGIVIVNGVFKTCDGGSKKGHGEIYGSLITMGDPTDTENSFLGGLKIGTKVYYSTQAINAAKSIAAPYTLAWWKEK